MKKKLLLLVIIGFNLKINLNAQTWISPIGIPAPPFGINEPAPAAPNPWTTATAGFYYVDNSSAQSTDSQTQNGVTDPSNGNNPGTPGRPRKTIPINLPAGSVVEVHGGPYTYSTGGQIKIHANGTQAQPVFIRGFSSVTKIKFSKPMYFYGSYGIIENIDLDNWSQSNDVGFKFDIADHLVLRHSEVRNGPKATTSSIVPGNGTYIVIFNNKIHDNGDWLIGKDCSRQCIDYNNDGDTVPNNCSTHPANIPSCDQDHHGIGGFNGSYVWILDNKIYHQSGDGLQINKATAHHIYVGRNEFWQNKQAGFWIKYASDVVFSQNISHDHAAGDSSPGQGMGLQYDPVRVWFLFNTSYNNVLGIETGSSETGGRQDVYFIGNRLYNNSQSGIQINGGSGTHRIIGNTIYNNPIGIENGYYNTTIVMVNNIIAGASNRHILFPDDTQTASRSTTTNNLFSSPARIEWGNGTVSNLSQFRTAFPTQCAACIESDPKFVNAATNDFHLQASSPAINAASATLISQIASTYQTLYGVDIAKDFDRVARPQQGAWDIGAYEYLKATITTHTMTPTYVPSTKSIKSNASPIPLSSSALAAVCINSTAFALTGGSPAGGTYSGVGVSNNTFDPTIAGIGSFTITYTDNSGTKSLQSITVNDCAAGIQDEEGISLVSVYPNPSNGIININLSSSEKSVINVMNTLNQVIYSKKLDAGTHTEQLDLTGYSKGIYFIHVISGTESIPRKIILK